MVPIWIRFATEHCRVLSVHYSILIWIFQSLDPSRLVDLHGLYFLSSCVGGSIYFFLSMLQTYPFNSMWQSIRIVLLMMMLLSFSDYYLFFHQYNLPSFSSLSSCACPCVALALILIALLVLLLSLLELWCWCGSCCRTSRLLVSVASSTKRTLYCFCDHFFLAKYRASCYSIRPPLSILLSMLLAISLLWYIRSTLLWLVIL